jgi:hypothetical protein
MGTIDAVWAPDVHVGMFVLWKILWEHMSTSATNAEDK